LCSESSRTGIHSGIAIWKHRRIAVVLKDLNENQIFEIKNFHLKNQNSIKSLIKIFNFISLAQYRKVSMSVDVTIVCTRANDTASLH